LPLLEGEWKSQEFGVFHGLSETVAGKCIEALCLNYRDGEVGLDFQEVIGAFSLFARVPSSGGDYRPIREITLLNNLVWSPARAVEGREDVLPAGIELKGALSSQSSALVRVK
jgi:hypothetical protein